MMSLGRTSMLNILNKFFYDVIVYMAKKKGGRKRKQKGGNIISDLMQSKPFGSFLSGANQFLKDSKLISNVANGLQSVLPPGPSSVAGVVGKAAGALGYGHKGKGLIRT